MGRLSKNHVLLFTIVGLALAGGWTCGVLLSAHDGGWGGESGLSGLMLGICGSASTPSATCNGVIDGRWGGFDFTLAGRRIVVPTAFIGLAYFAGLAVWFAMLTGRTLRSPLLRRLTILLVSGGFCGSVFFTVLMVSVLDQWCLLCAVAHLINAAIFASVLLYRGAVSRETSSDMTDGRPVTARMEWKPAVSATAVMCLVASGLWLYFDAVSVARRYWRRSASMEHVIDGLQSDREFVLREYHAQPTVDIPLRDPVGEELEGIDRPALDQPTLIVFGRFDCPPCRCFAGRWRGVIKPAFDGPVHVEYHHALPFLAGDSGDVRAADEYASYAVQASLAAEAARLQGGTRAFGRMHDLLFEHQKNQRGWDFAGIAEMAGIDGQQLVADMQSDMVRRAIVADALLARRLGVTKTPAVFLDNRRVPDLCLQSSVFWEAFSVNRRASRTRTVAWADDGSRFPISEEVIESDRDE